MSSQSCVEPKIDFKKLISRALYVGRKSRHPELAEDFAQWICLKVLEENLDNVAGLDFLFLNFKLGVFGKVGRPSFNLKRGAVPMDTLIGDSEITLHDVTPGTYPTPEEAFEIAEWINSHASQIDEAIKKDKTKKRKLRASPLGLEIFQHLLNHCDQDGIVHFFSTDYGRMKSVSNNTINLSLSGLINKGLVQKEKRGRYRVLSTDVTSLLSQKQLDEGLDPNSEIAHALKNTKFKNRR